MAFKAAEQSPYFVSQGMDVTDADWTLSENYSLVKLQAVSAELVRNNPIVASIMSNYVFNVVGGKVRVKSTDGKDYSNLRLDKNREKTLSGILRMIVSSSIQNGDVLINIVSKRGDTFVEIIESTRVETPPHKQEADGSSGIRNGVVYRAGRVVGYWVRKLGELTTLNNHKFVRKSTEDNPFGAILFQAPSLLRPDQSRGTPLFTPAMNTVRYFTDYLQTIMIQARVSACFSAFITSSNPTRTKQEFEKDGSSVEEVAKLKAGSVFYLNRGDKIEFASPNRPSDNTDQFIRRLLRIICSAMVIPYEFVNYDLKEVSYSSWKGAKLAFKQVVDTWRDDMGFVIDRIFYAKTRSVALKTLTKEQTLKVKYPIVGILDEEKTARADNMNVNNIKSKSVQDVCQELGKDYEELKQEKEEEALREVEIEALKERERDKYREEWGITFPEDKEEEERETKNREGEPEEPTEEDKRERRRQDGNW